VAVGDIGRFVVGFAGLEELAGEAQPEMNFAKEFREDQVT